MLTIGESKVHVKDGEILIEVGASSIKITDGNITLKSASIDHEEA